MTLPDSVPDSLPTSADFVADPHAFYAILRSRRPAHFVRFDNGLYGWLITRYDDARLVLADPRLSKDPRNAPQEWQEAAAASRWKTAQGWAHTC
ncbi:hypothetical protein [Nonomuraea sp. NPDC003804]|uniref:hypothetical protein n=1 Tax=Nonomuraea sp. NPDC003804 TaxID=3154547 RepID=UPI0033A250D7